MTELKSRYNVGEKIHCTWQDQQLRTRRGVLAASSLMDRWLRR
jgi:hypothetical protein